jgi:two-component system, OmpR family, phosphate regulon sensor histidine kinase PhoR
MTILAIVLAAALFVALVYLAYLFRALDRLRESSRRLSEAGRLRNSVGPAALSDAVAEVNRALEQRQGQLERVGEERDRLNEAIAASSDGILAVGRDGSIALANSAARFLLSPTVQVGLPLAQAVRDHEISAALAEALGGGNPEALNLEYGPSRRAIRVVVTPLPVGSDWRALLVIHDLTDLTRLERTRREFVSNVSHELRTPLAAVRAAVETLENGALSEPETAQTFLAGVHDEVDRMTRMVEQLLALSRIESSPHTLDFKVVDLVEVASSAVDRVRPMAEQRGLAVTLHVIQDSIPVQGDRALLEQAVMNLLQNAVKFTRRGRVGVALDVSEDEATVTVEDTGVGIAPSDLPHVFERFYKADRARSSDGTGLGLAIVKHAVEAHGGRVWATSEQGSGSIFAFRIPRARS